MQKQKLVFFFLIVFTCIVYSNHFYNSFHFDDFHTIVNNLSIRDLRNIPSFFSDGTTFSTLPDHQTYRPVVTTLNAIDLYFSGKELRSTFWFHMSIFISFLVTGLLLCVFVYQLLEITFRAWYNTWIALIITAWFWLHPANAETINYISARSDSFSTCMLLLGFVLYLYWPFAKKYYLYLLPVIIGFLAKETALLFFVLLFIYEILFAEKLSIAGIFTKFSKTVSVLKRLAIPALCAIGLLFLYKSLLPPTWHAGGGDAGAYLLTQPFAAGHYFLNFLLPINFIADAGWTGITSLADQRLYIGFGFILLLVIIAWLASFRQELRLICFGILWFLLALLPTSLVPLAELMNDHRTFFPYIGLFIVAAGIIQIFVRKYEQPFRNSKLQWLAITSMVGIGILLAVMTIHRNKIWRTENSLWKEVTRKAPGNGRGWMNYGITQMQAGDLVGAEQSFIQTRSLLPNYSYIYINLGILKAYQKNYSEADVYFKQAISMDPYNPDCYPWYGEFLWKQGRTEEARKIVSQGLELSPQHLLLNNLLQQLPVK